MGRQGQAADSAGLRRLPVTLHPASDPEGNPVSWGEVAAALGTTAHREMQWHAVVGTYDYSNFKESKWPRRVPDFSELEEAPLAALCEILAPHTTTPRECFFGISTIHGGVEESFPTSRCFGTHIAISRSSPAPYLPRGRSRSTTITRPRSVSSPSSLPTTSRRRTSNPEPGGCRAGPRLDLAPGPRLVRLATPRFDFDSTLVGGSRGLIDTRFSPHRISRPGR